MVLPGSPSRWSRAERDSDIYSGRQPAPRRACTCADITTRAGLEMTTPCRFSRTLPVSGERIQRRQSQTDRRLDLREAAVYEQFHPGDVAAVIGGEKHDS